VTEIVIHRCTLRLVRRNGWAWGGDPRRLLAGAVQALPGLIASRLGELLPEGAEVEIAAPVRIRLPLRLNELIALGKSGETANSAAEPSALMRHLDDALRNTIAELTGTFATETEVIEDTNHLEADSVIHATGESGWAPPVLRIMTSWWQEQVLAERLLSFSLTALQAWHDNIVGMASAISPEKIEPADEELKALAQRILAEPLPVAAGRARTLTQRLLILAAVAAIHRIAPSDARQQRLLSALCPLGQEDTQPSLPAKAVDDTTPDLSQQRPTPTPRLGQAPAHLARTVAAVPHHSKAIEFELHVQSALPFLLLGPLARIGYLDTLHATLEAAGLSDQLPCFPMLLSRKALDPPQRGWRFSPASVATSAALAGLLEPIPEPAVADFARLFAPHVSPLDGLVCNKLVEGHRKGMPLILIRADMGSERGLWLLDNEGLLPLSWSSEAAPLFRHLARMQGDIVLVPADSAQPEILTQLDDAGFSFITDAPPTRDEHWRKLTGTGPERNWTNAPRTKESTLLKAAANLGSVAVEAQAAWQELAIARPAVVVQSDPTVERSLTLAAAFALGMLAWTLWRERETTTPLLALERFGDLDARVRFTRDTVQVHLPMGRRYQDLLDHGLLADVRHIPWLDGRPLQFSAG